MYEAVRKQSRRSRLEQLLLLAARILVLVLLVLALARPQWADANKLATGTPPTLHVLVIDASLSLGRAAEKTSAGKTLFEIAKGAAKEIVRRSASGDRFGGYRKLHNRPGWMRPGIISPMMPGPT